MPPPEFKDMSFSEVFYKIQKEDEQIQIQKEDEQIQIQKEDEQIQIQIQIQTQEEIKQANLIKQMIKESMPVTNIEFTMEFSSDEEKE
jgi:hypothetical protein